MVRANNDNGSYHSKPLGILSKSAHTIATQYTVCWVPDHPESERWEITVERRRLVDGTHMWVVRWKAERLWLSSKGVWDFKAGPDEEWLADHRFDLVTARHLAETAAPGIVSQGVRAKDVRT